MRVGVPDPSLTGFSGVAAVAELVDRLDVVGRLDRGIGSIKNVTGAPARVSCWWRWRSPQLLGADARWSGWTRQRVDVGVSELSAVPVLASATAAGLASPVRSAAAGGVEAAVADRDRSCGGRVVATGASGRAGVGGDGGIWTPTDVGGVWVEEVGVAYNYAG